MSDFYFYCEDCGAVFEVRNMKDLTGSEEFNPEAQDITCPICRNAECVYVPSFDILLTIENEVWSVKRAERALHEAERKLVEKVAQTLSPKPEAAQADGE